MSKTIPIITIIIRTFDDLAEEGEGEGEGWLYIDRICSPLLAYVSEVSDVCVFVCVVVSDSLCCLLFFIR